MAEGVELATAWVNLVPSTENIRAAIEKELGGPLEEAAKRSGKRTAELWSNELRLGGAIVAAGSAVLARSMAQAASDTNEAVNKVDVVFGQAAAGVRDFTEDAATSLGLSRRAALDYTGTLGNLLLSTGQSAQASAEMSTTLVQLAADLGSFNNVGTEEALEAIRAGLVGETEPLKRFGINLNDATLRQEALNQGIYDGTGVLSAAQKSQAAYAIILEQSATAQGDFARTSDGAANKAKILAAQIDDQKARIGEGLLPAYSGLLSAGTRVADVFDALPPSVGAGTLALTGMGGAALFLTPKVIEGGRAIRELGGLVRSGASQAFDFARGLDRTRAASIGAQTALAGLAGVAIWKLLDDGADSVDRFVNRMSAGQGGIGRIEAMKDALADLERLGIRPLFDVGPLTIYPSNEAADTANAIEKLRKDIEAAELDLLATGTAAEIAGYQFVTLDSATVAAALSAKRAGDDFTTLGEDAGSSVEQVEKLASTWRDSLDESLGLASMLRDQADAAKAYEQAQATAAGRGEEWAEAARRIADAEDAVADAREGVVDATRNQEAAVQRLRSAEANAVQVRRDLNDAYDEAQKRLEALRRTVAGDRLSVREAEMALAQAKEEAALAVDDPSTLSVDEREQAQIRLERAELALAEARARAAENAEELNEREQAGLDQSPEVLAAKEAIEAADRAVVEAQEALIEASARVEEANARVIESEDAVTQAIKDRQKVQDEARASLAELGDDYVSMAADVAVALVAMNGDVEAGVASLKLLLSTLDPGSTLGQRIQDLIDGLRGYQTQPGYYGGHGYNYTPAPAWGGLIPDTPPGESDRPRRRSGDVYNTVIYGADTEKWKREHRRMGGTR